MTSLAGELAPKRMELLHELIPRGTAIALLVNPANPAIAEFTTREVEVAARARGLQVHVLYASTEQDFDLAFTNLLQLHASGLVVAVDSFFTGRREHLGAMALRYKIPAVYQYRDFTAAGGVISYGGSLTEPYRLVGRYTGRILNGEKPAELPIQQVTKLELIINMKAANELHLAVPSSLLARADEVIE
jgi:putative ABC transport system substrate-binding protein